MRICTRPRFIASPGGRIAVPLGSRIYCISRGPHRSSWKPHLLHLPGAASQFLEAAFIASPGGRIVVPLGSRILLHLPGAAS
jgi:hypothetical protein